MNIIERDPITARWRPAFSFYLCGEYLFSIRVPLKNPILEIRVSSPATSVKPVFFAL